jgi:hypothetical protein
VRNVFVNCTFNETDFPPVGLDRITPVINAYEIVKNDEDCMAWEPCAIHSSRKSTPLFAAHLAILAKILDGRIYRHGTPAETAAITNSNLRSTQFISCFLS